MLNQLQSVDFNILVYIQEHMKSPALDRVMVFFTMLGNAGLIWITIAVLLLLQKQYRKCGIYLIFALYLSMLLGDELLKPVFHRIRPCNLYPQIPLLIHRPLTYSFPSGHTMVGFAAATILFYFDRYIGTKAISWLY
jgi:undecaprenyl-diphosphatase